MYASMSMKLHHSFQTNIGSTGRDQMDMHLSNLGTSANGGSLNLQATNRKGATGPRSLHLFRVCGYTTDGYLPAPLLGG